MRKFLCILSTLIFLSSCAVISEKAAQKAGTDDKCSKALKDAIKLVGGKV